MRVVIDTNVLLDVFQNRTAHYAGSAAVLAMVERQEIDAVMPAHALTTLFYLVRKYGTRVDAEAAMDRVLDHFEIGALDAAGWRKARALPMKDFEDAVVATVAESFHCSLVITRNTDDFLKSPVPAFTPIDFLGQYFP